MNTTVIVPSLNPDGKMVNTVKSILAEGFTDVVVVNDGSGPEYLPFFEEVAKLPGVTLLTHEVNKGKGRAMKTAFAYILENRKDVAGVVTVDADGQHLPKDIRACAEAMEASGERVILGVRDFSQPQVPETISQKACSDLPAASKSVIRRPVFGRFPLSTCRQCARWRVTATNTRLTSCL